MRSLLTTLCLLVLLPGGAFASSGENTPLLDLTRSGLGIIALVVFILAYLVVLGEEFLHLRKSKPVIVAAGIIWMLVGFAYYQHGDTTGIVAVHIRHNLYEFAELMLFLLAAMTYINTMEDRNIFKALRAWLINKGFSLKAVFWITGLLAFFISPLADNLTTALLMGAVVMAVGGDNRKFVVLACINVVVAANAGGAFSPFGDITTLMVWQAEKAPFFTFFNLFVPSLVNWLVPAIIMSFAVSKKTPTAVTDEVKILQGGFVIIGLFAFTITLAVTGHSLLHLPPFLGMMTGLGILKFYGYYLSRCDQKSFNQIGPSELGINNELLEMHYKPRRRPFDIFISMKRAEWDTLMFFYGVVMSVGGLGMIGYLALTSQFLYEGLGPTWANVIIGILSALVDNIPVMFAVLQMNPTMDVEQWLLVTLTAGVGGSMLSIGSAAGVALMGQARGMYTFFAHLKWTWAIALGYAASITTHLYISGVL